MKPVIARALVYCAIGGLAIAALQQDPPDLGPRHSLLLAAPAPQWNDLVDTLDRGESLGILLARGGLSSAEQSGVLRAATSLDPRKLQPGTAVTVRTMATDSSVSEIILQLALDRLLHIRRIDSSWAATEELLPWTTDTLIVRGEITSNLYAAMDAAAGAILTPGGRELLANELADVFEYRVAMNRDLQVGDRFEVLAERRVGPGGTMRIGELLAASMTLSGKHTTAVRFDEGPGTEAKYYDQDGSAMRSRFLQFPIQFRRISSGFGTREHPILGVVRQHQGVDYAAAAGTPVRVIGDGVVTFAGVRGGYGNLVEVRHPNGFVSRYGHLQRFATGIRAGTHVSVEEVIAYVGMTGLATGPHLHFEVLVGGVQRNPATVLKGVGTEPMPVALRDRFAVVRDQMVAALGSPEGRVSLAELH